jgi:3-methyladenine DNA glycosylase AlkD
VKNEKLKKRIEEADDDAIGFIKALMKLPTISGKNEIYFKGNDAENEVINVRMADVFATAKRYIHMPIEQIAILLKSKIYEVRLGAVSIMDFQARDKKTTNDQKKKLFDLYLNNHSRINNWDLVDRGAPYIIGGYLQDKPKTVLYSLAKSSNPLERRTAIVATYFFIRQNQTDDTFKIAAMLVHDKEEQVNMAVGSWVREAGKRSPDQLLSFLDKYAATMPRKTLRYAIEKLDADVKKKYMEVKGSGKTKNTLAEAPKKK